MTSVQCQATPTKAPDLGMTRSRLDPGSTSAGEPDRVGHGILLRLASDGQ